MDSKPSTLLRRIHNRLEQDHASDEAILAALDDILHHFDCQAGTIHDLDPTTGLLRLRAQRGIPPAVLERVRSIPIGKGMGGLAAERRQPVQVCNLQTDASGVAKPSARETRMEGSIAVPMLPGGRLCGVLGIAKPVAYEFTAPETELLVEVADLLGTRLGG
jgi:L-methionine (R)-S-oxide reductase